jgi:hypothetical protein
MKFKLYTLADITPTGARRGEGSRYHQEQNYMTAIQTIGLRTNPLDVRVTDEEQSVSKLSFGKKHKGKQRVWCLEFEVDSNGAHSVEMLTEDFNLVPFNNELDETVTFDNPLFVTNNDELCNIFFEIDDK